MGSGGSSNKAPLTIPPQTTLGSRSNPLSTWQSPGPPPAMLDILTKLAHGSRLTANQWDAMASPNQDFRTLQLWGPDSPNRRGMTPERPTPPPIVARTDGDDRKGSTGRG